MMAERAGAARRRERRQRSWWRHEQLSVAAALASARHHSAGPGVVTRREGQQEEVEVKQHSGLRAQTTPPPGTRPAALTEPMSQQGVWPGAPRQPGHVVPSAAAPLLAVPAAEGIDAATLSFLLQRALDDKRKEEEEAVETAELAKLEEKVAAAEVRLLDALQQDRDEGVRVTPETWNSLSRVEQLAVRWYVAKDEVRRAAYSSCCSVFGCCLRSTRRSDPLSSSSFGLFFLRAWFTCP